MIRQACPWLRLHTDSGLCQLLDRLGLSRKEGRLRMRSPDPDYCAKTEYIRRICEAADGDPGKVVVYQDEASYYRRPSLAPVYQPKGSDQKAVPTRSEDPKFQRICGAMDVATGQVFWQQSAKFGVEQLIAYYHEMVDHWPEADTIYVVQDNASIHFHHELLEHLAAQQWPWQFWTPANWPDPEPAARREGPLSIQLVPLPTYAPWLNPAEKLWRWMKQDILHMHELAENWHALKRAVANFLDQFTDGSDELLRYAGLLPS